MLEARLTTSDNPFDPFDEFDAWFAFDTARGYHTLPYLARVVVTSDELPIEDQHRDIDRAIDDIVKENILGIYVKVEKEVNESDSQLE